MVLHSGEIIFLDYASHLALGLFARIHAIPQRIRLDVWALLCEPYLDTSFTKKDRERTGLALRNAGFTDQEVETIRADVGGIMLTYNCVMWEWAHLSHYDLLIAFGEEEKSETLVAAKERENYAWANEIANRAPEAEEFLKDPVSRAESKMSTIAFKMTRNDSKIDFDAFKKRMLDAIVDAYASPHRHYHNLIHVLKVVEHVELYRCSEEEKTILILAAWFHDFVYDPQRTDNEEKSAALFLEMVADTGLSEDARNSVVKLILLTKDHHAALTTLEQVMADADRMIFTEDEETYKKYRVGIRNEYAHLETNAYCKGRLDFLTKLQNDIYHHGQLFFNAHPLHETQAKKNITNEISELKRAWQ